MESFSLVRLILEHSRTFKNTPELWINWKLHITGWKHDGDRSKLRVKDIVWELQIESESNKQSPRVTYRVWELKIESESYR